jgi:processive 1,2-diacylglycerol beta-glucosyltransferase
MEKKILILTAGYGEGHNAAARGIRDGLVAVSGGTAAVEMHDLFAETFGFLNDWIRKGYLTVINRAPGPWSRFYKWLDRQEEYASHMRWLFAVKARLRQLLLRFQPMAVVSVFPAYPHLMETILEGATPPFRQVICITDSITVNAIWYRCVSGLFLVPNEQSAATFAAAGVPNEKVRVSGFPVSPKFVELGEMRQPPEARGGFQILYVINAGGQAASELIRGLTKIANVKLTVTVGRDQRLRRAVEALRAEAGCEFEIIGWTDQLPRLMLESHLLISKAGGATVQETIAAKCPMIINQVVPGQEEGNARLIVETRSGVVATSPDAIVAAVEEAFADDARLWREWSANISRLSRPRASLDIAELLLAL